MSKFARRPRAAAIAAIAAEVAEIEDRLIALKDDFDERMQSVPLMEDRVVAWSKWLQDDTLNELLRLQEQLRRVYPRCKYPPPRAK